MVVLICTNISAQDPFAYSVGQIIYHNTRSFVVTSYENSQFPFEGKKEYSETIITAERPIMILGIEFAKDLLHIINKQGKNPTTGTYVISDSTTLSRSYALKSYLISILGILFAYNWSKSLVSPVYPTTSIVTKLD